MTKAVLTNVYWHPADTAKEFTLSANYRQRYHTTTEHCFCNGFRFNAGPCKHIKLEKFIKNHHKRIARDMRYQKALVKHGQALPGQSFPETALKAHYQFTASALRYWESILVDGRFFTYEKRKEAGIYASWLQHQENMLRRRIELVERLNRMKRTPVKSKQNNTQITLKKQGCQHVNHREEGHREKWKVCIDCGAKFGHYYPMST